MRYVRTLGSVVEERERVIKDFKQIENKIKPFFYIVEDEGLIILAQLVVKELPTGRPSVHALQISFSKERGEYGTIGFRQKALEGNFRRELMNNDGVQEFVDRISEICYKNGYRVVIEKNPKTGIWRGNYIDIFKSN